MVIGGLLIAAERAGAMGEMTPSLVRREEEDRQEMDRQEEEVGKEEDRQEEEVGKEEDRQ